MSQHHSERKHSKFSASGADRWFNCQGSVALSEDLPDKTSPWAEEGTKAHEVLEKILLDEGAELILDRKQFPGLDMFNYGAGAAKFIIQLKKKFNAEMLVETRIHLDFIHPEMFGTFDAAVVDDFGTLHVFDYKYGAGHMVSPKENLQMIFYGIGLAHKYDWNFKKVRLWIIQPRIRGYDGPTFWELSIEELKRYVSVFKHAVKRVELNPNSYNEGQWCHWCKAKAICPLKQEEKLGKAKQVFGKITKGETNGKR